MRFVSIAALYAAPVLAAVPAPNTTRADAIKEAFLHSWNGYVKYAFPKDELNPVSNGASNSRNGWGASAVDALSTALMMDMPDVVNKILEHVDTVDFTTTTTQVSLFETTIRYLGGLVSAYDLLSGPLASMKINRNLVPRLLEQADVLADALSFAFDTASGAPAPNLWFTNKTFTEQDPSIVLAEIGTLVLEWTRLSDQLNDDRYAKMVQKAEGYLLDPKPQDSEAWPGLLSWSVNTTTGEFTSDRRGSWGGGTDSFYEYLIKMYVYDPQRFARYKDRWILAVDSTMAHLTQHPIPSPDTVWVAEWTGQNLRQSQGHLTCFIGGNFILGGQVLNKPAYQDYGLALTDGCHYVYSTTATRIAPEGWSWNETNVPPNQKDFFDRTGYYITNSEYILRPEVIESYYYAYRATGDPKFADWAWDAFLAINSTLRTDSGFAQMNDVNAPNGGDRGDFQQSFWFAEVTKYLYLMYAPDADWQMATDGNNKFVYNTEAHPVKVFGVNYPGGGGGEGAGAGVSPIVALVALAVSMLTQML